MSTTSALSTALSTASSRPAVGPARLLIEVRPGEGGEDAEVFAAELASAVGAFCLRAGIPMERESSEGRSLRLTLHGRPTQLRAARAALTPLAGVHRIQRIPRSDKRGRRHTSTASLAVLEESSVAAVELREADLTVEFYRGSGPGGQHRNKVSTAVRLRHLPTGIVITRESGRSQSGNLQDARRDLLERLTERSRLNALKQQNCERTAQVDGADRSAKTWTHNAQRGDSVCHHSGLRLTLRDFLRGRFTG